MNKNKDLKLLLNIKISISIVTLITSTYTRLIFNQINSKEISVLKFKIYI